MTAAHTTGPAPVRPANAFLMFRRNVGEWIGWAWAAFAFLGLALIMVLILAWVFQTGIGALKPAVFTEPSSKGNGGLLNAIEGTLVLSLGALALATPFGMAAGIYASEFKTTLWASVIRFLSDILVGVPSIVMGYVGYVIMVVTLGWKQSVMAACITVGVIALPYICRTTELALRQVSMNLREAGFAIGGGDATVILRVVLPSALPGVMTGVLLALSISVGETAPLIYTAGYSNYMWDGKLFNSPIGYLTGAIWNLYNDQTTPGAAQLAYAAAFLVTALVLGINIIARVILRGRQTSRA
jgi:phosphate transport system permease protein